MTIVNLNQSNRNLGKREGGVTLHAESYGGGGVKILPGMTVREAMALDPIQFEPREVRPMQTLGHNFMPVDVPGAGCVVGTLSGKAFAVVGQSYKVHNPELCAEAFETVAGEAGANLDLLWTLRGGRLMAAQASVPGLSFDVGTRDRPDPVNARLTFLTSFDGTHETMFGELAVRPVCENIFAHAISEAKKGKHMIGIRHTSNSEGRVRTYAAELAKLRAGFASFAAIADKLASRSFSAAEFAEFAAALIPLPTGDASPTKAQNKRDALADLFVNGIGQDLPGAKGTAWGALNAVTQWTTWATPVRNGGQGDRWLSSVVGDGADLASNALMMLSAVA